MRCDECKWFRPQHGSSLGECRRYPGKAIDRKYAMHWPLVAKNEWCGEFKKAAKARKNAD